MQGKADNKEQFHTVGVDPSPIFQAAHRQRADMAVNTNQQGDDNVGMRSDESNTDIEAPHTNDEEIANAQDQNMNELCATYGEIAFNHNDTNQAQPSSTNNFQDTQLAPLQLHPQEDQRVEQQLIRSLRRFREFGAIADSQRVQAGHVDGQEAGPPSTSHGPVDNDNHLPQLHPMPPHYQPPPQIVQQQPLHDGDEDSLLQSMRQLYRMGNRTANHLQDEAHVQEDQGSIMADEFDDQENIVPGQLAPLPQPQTPPQLPSRPEIRAQVQNEQQHPPQRQVLQEIAMNQQNEELSTSNNAASQPSTAPTCSQADTVPQVDNSVAVDASVDASVDAPVDAPVGAPVNAPVNAPVDAPVDVPTSEALPSDVTQPREAVAGPSDMAANDADDMEIEPDNAVEKNNNNANEKGNGNGKSKKKDDGDEFTEEELKDIRGVSSFAVR